MLDTSISLMVLCMLLYFMSSYFTVVKYTQYEIVYINEFHGTDYFYTVHF